MFLFDSIFHSIKPYIHFLGEFWLIFSELSNGMGVESWGCTISDTVICKTMAFLEFMKEAAHSASEYDATKFLIICEMEIISPFFSLGSNV